MRKARPWSSPKDWRWADSITCDKTVFDRRAAVYAFCTRVEGDGAQTGGFNEKGSCYNNLRADGLVRHFFCGAVASAKRTSQPVIRFIVGFAAGGGNDMFARLVVQKFQENTGATTIVDNKPGAGGRISAEFAAHAPADGYTVLVGATGQMSIAAAIYPDLDLSRDQELHPAQHDRVVPAGAGGAGRSLRPRT